MKIGFEAQRVFRKAKHGMDVVALELMRRLPTLDGHNNYLLFAREGPDHQWADDIGVETHQLKAWNYAAWEQLSLPAAIRKYKPDILHCTANTAPLVCPVPLVLTLHDIIFLEKNNLQGSAYQNAGNIYRRMVVPRAIRHAEAIITVSDYERKLIEAKFPEAASKLSVIHHGVDERFHNRYAKEEVDLFRRRHDLPENYILFLGNTAPKKNTANVLKAYAHYRELVPNGLPIVITDYEKRLVAKQLAEIKKTSLSDSIFLPGYISMGEMPLLYAGSMLFLYPSLRESFGLPILEAMACGIPVITSDVTAMPEIAGAAGMLVDPRQPEKIGQAVYEVLSNPEKRNKLIEKGFARASYFTWHRAAEQLISLYSNHQH